MTGFTPHDITYFKVGFGLMLIILLLIAFALHDIEKHLDPRNCNRFILTEKKEVEDE